jgi:hypothetical protein
MARPFKQRKGRFVIAARERTNFDDSRGKVRVFIRRVNEHGKPGYLKGNINRSITVYDATVTEVADIIERALGGEV